MYTHIFYISMRLTMSPFARLAMHLADNPAQVWGPSPVTSDFLFHVCCVRKLQNQMS